MIQTAHGSSAQERSLPRLLSFGVTLLLLFVAMLLFIPVVNGYWLADDFTWVHDFIQYDWHNIPALFHGDWSRASAHEYRPLWAVSFLLDLTLWGANPFALHMTNIGLHVIASALVWYLVAYVLDAGRIAALLTLALFILAPIHVEPVTWISARGHILAPIFMLTSIIFFAIFKRRGGPVRYVASLVAFAAALTTQEVAVALPPLLLAFDSTDEPRVNWRWVLHVILRNGPFWLLLAIYLAFRILMFGQLGREESSTGSTLWTTYFAFRTLWLSFIPIDGTSVWMLSVKWTLIVCVLGLLIGPFLFLRKHQLYKYAQRFLYFAILWPIIATVVLMGANSERHYYLASVGPAVILGIASACLLNVKRIPITLLATVLIILLIINGVAVTRGVREVALNGARSWQLRHEVDLAIEHATRDSNSIVVVIPEVPDNQRVLWDYFYPVALQPPFTSSSPSVNIISSFTSCHCSAEEWKATYNSTIEQIMRDEVDPIYVVEWNDRQSTFVTQVLHQTTRLHDEYLRPGGSLVRSQNAGRPAPTVP